MRAYAYGYAEIFLRSFWERQDRRRTWLPDNLVGVIDAPRRCAHDTEKPRFAVFKLNPSYLPKSITTVLRGDSADDLNTVALFGTTSRRAPSCRTTGRTSIKSASSSSISSCQFGFIFLRILEHPVYRLDDGLIQSMDAPQKIPHAQPHCSNSPAGFI